MSDESIKIFDVFENVDDEVVNKIMNIMQDIFPKIVESRSNEIASEILLFWGESAVDASSWGERYASTLSIKSMKGGKGSAKVYVDKAHPNYMFVKMMEEGVKSWSIKDALLKGKAAQRNFLKYGTVFVRIPFRYRVSGTTKPSSMFAGVMPEAIYKMAKSGENIGDQFGRMAGLKRYSKGPVHGQYFTFRTVSEKSDGWEHPGKMQTPVFKKVLQKVGSMIEKSMVKWVKTFEKELESKL